MALWCPVVGEAGRPADLRSPSAATTPIHRALP